jgi:dipeptidyl aminopeptidase/acylaminoacyl peptidase
MVWVFVIIAVVGLIVLGCCGGIVALIWQEMKPTDFPEQTKDYADARKGFSTKLINAGKAPQDYKENEKPPEGVKEIAYKSGDLKLKAWIKPPDLPIKKDSFKPAVLFLHGGFSFSMEDWDQCRPFRDAGFVTMTPMLRGENGLPGSYSMFYDEVDDVLAAAEVLASTPGVDPNRIYVAGHSVGGTLAMLASMTSNRFHGCASFSGSPDQPVWVRGQEHLIPFEESDFNEMVMRSPLAFPRSFKCPARLYWGDQEEPMFKFGTERLAEKAKAAGKDVEAIQVQGDHMTAVNPAMKQAIAFFRQQK